MEGVQEKVGSREGQRVICIDAVGWSGSDTFQRVERNESTEDSERKNYDQREIREIHPDKTQHLPSPTESIFCTL